MDVDWQALAEPFWDAAIMIAGVLAIHRLVGLRSFSKMSGYDFPITVATGSVIASVVVAPGTDWPVGLAALAALFVWQVVASRGRRASDRVQRALDNEPLLLMEGETVFEDNLRAAKVTRDDLIGKLREANVLHPREVRAVVFEPTGDVSVLHGDPDGAPLHDMLMEGVRRSHQ